MALLDTVAPHKNSDNRDPEKGAVKKKSLFFYK